LKRLAKSYEDEAAIAIAVAGRGRRNYGPQSFFYARFVRPGVVVAARETDSSFFDYDVTLRHLEILRSAVDSKGRSLDVIEIENPTQVRPEYAAEQEFAAGYINFYVANGGVILPEFGDDKADRAARATLANLFPEREIVQLNIDAIAAGGGGIHCATQQEPRVNRP